MPVFALQMTEYALDRAVMLNWPDNYQLKGNNIYAVKQDTQSVLMSEFIHHIR